MEQNETEVNGSDVTVTDQTQEPDNTRVKAADEPNKPKHKATYATDKRKGGYMIRVAGPYPDRFVGREVPVETMAGSTHMEKLISLVWSGVDQKTGGRVALYKFELKPRDEQLAAW